MLDADQTPQLLAHLVGSWLYAPVLLAAGTGLRRGEILALEWGDVALREAPWRGAVTVRRSVTREAGKWVVGPPKGRRERAVSLPGFVAAGLAAHRSALPPEWRLVCPDRFGNWTHPSLLSREVGRALLAAGLRKVRFHDLRHGHASHRFELAVPLPAISARLGHSSPKVTAEVYAHLLPGADDRAAQGIDRLIGGTG